VHFGVAAVILNARRLSPRSESPPVELKARNFPIFRCWHRADHREIAVDFATFDLHSPNPAMIYGNSESRQACQACVLN
jgi:hypothetical protein